MSQRSVSDQPAAIPAADLAAALRGRLLTLARNDDEPATSYTILRPTVDLGAQQRGG